MPGRPAYYPLPHHVPKYPGGLSFRFAMAHDVLHERYPKHGPAHYRERNRVTREKLAALAPDDPAAFPLTDDLAAGLARLGQLNEAVTILRAKLAKQQAKGLTGRDLYSTYANLGAILIHVRFNEAIAGDEAARKQFREGVELVKKSVEVNPEAHFGREQWQVAYATFILEAIDKPEFLRQLDFIGNKLDMSVSEMRGRATRRNDYSALATSSSYGSSLKNPDTISDPEIRNDIREYITPVGAYPSVKEGVWNVSSVPFDEPALGIVGMWRQGIGADPHFALCLGEIMLRVGQRFIAWEAFERASRLADRFWPDETVQQSFRDHCKKRQTEIEATLPASEAAELRPRFDAELAFGEGYQRDYQKYEEAKIAAGVPIADEHFYDEFNATHPPIASASGSEEWYAVEGRTRYKQADAWRHAAAVGWGLFAAGVAAAATAFLVRLLYRPPATMTASPSPSESPS